MNDQAIVDTLKEAARYMRRDPETARGLIAQAILEIKPNVGPVLTANRLIGNLWAAYRWAVVEPDVAAGYCLGACFEIQAESMKGRS